MVKKIKKFTRLKNPSSFRRIASVDWKFPNDPTVHASLKIEASKIVEFIDEYNQTHPIKISPTHIIAKSAAIVLKKYPDLNGIIKWKKIYLRNSVDIFLQVSIPESEKYKKDDLSGAKIENCDQKSLQEISEQLLDKSKSIRKHQDPQFKKTFSLLKVTPSFLLGPFIRVMSFLTHNLGFNFPKLGLPADPFGSAMVTSVGMMGVPAAYPPLVPLSRVPFIICVGEVVKMPWVINDEIVIRPIMDLKFTFDHRYMDGSTGAKMIHFLREILAHPEKYFF